VPTNLLTRDRRCWGWGGSPYTVIDTLAAALCDAGYLVETPEMCWSYRRIYDRSLLDCLTEIDAAAARERSRGAGRIVIAGMSQGGDAALVYGARRTDLAGIIALAPAASPEHQIRVPQIAQSVAAARAMLVLRFNQKVQRVPPLAGRSREAASGPVNHLMGSVH
jgi:dienelactone hydrolase